MIVKTKRNFIVVASITGTLLKYKDIFSSSIIINDEQNVLLFFKFQTN